MSETTELTALPSNKADVKVSVDQAVEMIGFGRFQIALIAVCGLLQAVDAIEMLLLSVLGPAVGCEWHLTEHEIALITTAVFLGMLVGCPLWGALADRKGRWGTLFITSVFITYYGLLSAGSASYGWLLALRGLVGFGIGGVMAAAASLFSEFMPSTARAKAMTALLCCWSIGSVAMAGLSYLVLPRLGWRWLVGIAAVPLVVSTFTFLWLPQSPRYLFLSGQPERALQILNRVARMNGRPELAVSLKATADKRGHLLQLFHRKYVLSTVLQWVIWFGSGFVYYGIVLVSTELPRVPHRCLQDWSSQSITHSNAVDESCCPVINKDTYIAILVSSLGEFIALPMNAVILDLWGRKLTMAFSSICGGLMYFFLNFCLSKIGLDLFLLITRTFCHSVFCAAYVYTNESYPTSIRVLGMGVCSALARIGAMITPFVAQVLLPKYSTLAATLVYTGVMLLMAVCSLLLPIETKGRALPQTVDDSSEGEQVKDKTEDKKSQNYDTFKDK